MRELQALQEKLQDTQARLDTLQNMRSQGSSRLEEEIVALRGHVALLEAHRDSLRSSIDPPPEYVYEENLYNRQKWLWMVYVGSM